MQQNRLAIAAVAFVALLGVAIFTVRQRDAALETGGDDAEAVPTPPEIDGDALTELVITRPGEEEGDPRESVTLTKGEDGWRVTAPLEAEADTTAVQTVLDKLGELSFTGVAANNPENHARLEVDAEGGIEVIAKAGGDEVAHFFVGAYRSRNTMLRMDGEDAVVMAEGSIKYAFNKALKEWRNRLVLDVDPARVASVLFEVPPTSTGEADAEPVPGRRFAFLQGTDGWAQAPGDAPIERFGAAKVRSVIASASRLRAVDFAAPGQGPSDVGLTAPTGTVTLLVGPEAETDGDEDAADGDAADGDAAAESGPDLVAALDAAAPLPEGYERVVLRVGAQDGEDREFFLMREGSDVIYVVSQYLADRLRPDVDAFQEPEPGEEPETPPGMPPGGLGGLGGPGGQLPPELMQQLQQQLGMAN